MRVYIGPHEEDGSKREIDVHVHDYDVWDAFHTLALIIAPVLKRLRAETKSSAIVEDEDVPEFMRGTGDTYIHEKWMYILDELIWTFETVLEDDEDGSEQERILNGFRLFGKYYQDLWS